MHLASRPIAVLSRTLRAALGEKRWTLLCMYRGLLRWCSPRGAYRVLRRSDDVVWIRVAPLGVELPIRPGTADADDVIDSLVGRYHLPPAAITPATIVDAGLCTGLTLLDLAIQYPSAKLVGVEPQPYYADLCRTLTARFESRVEVMQAALTSDASERATLKVVEGWEHGASLLELADEPTSSIEVATISLNTIVDQLGDIDYLNLDIEGTERDVLTRNTEWMQHTWCINVEVHHGYTLEECRVDIERGGFVAKNGAHPSCIVGIKSKPPRSS